MIFLKLQPHLPGANELILSYISSPESQRRDTDEQLRLERLSQSLDDENEVFENNEDYLKARCYKLDKNFKHVAEQKVKTQHRF